jgi:hypothetical protein
MPERTPNARVSYDADVTTPRPLAEQRFTASTLGIRKARTLNKELVAIDEKNSAHAAIYCAALRPEKQDLAGSATPDSMSRSTRKAT